MKVLRNIKVPTGNIMIVEGDKGKLECLSIGDYGQESNIKAEFLGLNRPIEHVEHQEMLPLEDKWVVTISTQYGCNSGCVFCDVPKVGKGINATYEDLKGQVVESLKLHPEVEFTKRLNVHYARMGEPTWNPNVIEFSKNLLKEVRPYIGRSIIHPVVSTMLPRKNNNLTKFLADWMEIKNYNFRGEAGLQFSINSTSDKERDIMFSGNSLSLQEISEIGKYLPNNTDRYDNEVKRIPSGSTVKLIMLSKWYLCQFNAEIGVADSNGELSGVWRCMANVKYLV
jgi:23S rRNA (adenine2503-C2)-methyltransferase